MPGLDLIIKDWIGNFLLGTERRYGVPLPGI